MPTLVSHPEEVKVISRRFGQGAADIDKYIELGGYSALRKAIEQGPEWVINEMKASNLRGRGGRRLPYWPEVVVRAQAEHAPQVRAGERR